MAYLFAVTLLWAFSFSLIGVYLAGQVDPWFSVLMRIALATLVFLPFLRVRHVNFNTAIKLMVIGAVQLGLMYVFYYHSFLYLSVPEVLLFTVMTPIYVTLINDVLRRQFSASFLLSAFIATSGAVAIRYNGINEDFILGFLLVQSANVCFALGQVGYKRLLTDRNLDQKSIFAWFFMGALVVASVCYLFFGDAEKLPSTPLQWGILIYLGTIASGVGYFAWNKGATMVNVGALAVMNNLLIPAGLFVNLFLWGEGVDMLRLLIGGGIIFIALVLNQIMTKKHALKELIFK